MIDLSPSPVAKRAGYGRLAMHYAATGRLENALASYQEYFRQYPEGSAWTWHNYSIWLMEAKRYREALDASNRALSFFEFGVARDLNNEARKALGMATVALYGEVERYPHGTSSNPCYSRPPEEVSVACDGEMR
jgi:tetratricopeptide (TPR) repeat protein